MPFWLGVELFFVISGFVVTKSFTSKRMSLRAFYVRRVFRLWPTLAVFAALVILINPWAPFFAKTGWRALGWEYLSVLFGYFNLRNASSSFYAGAMWSLSVEEQFYLAVPITLLTLSWVFRSWRPAACRWYAIGFVVLLSAIRCGLCFETSAKWLAGSAWMQVLCYLATRRFDFLALGVLLFFQAREAPLLWRLGGLAQRWLMYAALLLPLPLIYLMGSAFDSPAKAPLLHSVGMTVCGLAFYAVVGLAAQDRDLLGLPGAADRALLYLGSRSYGIYVLHFPLFVAGWLLVNACTPWVFSAKSVLWYGFLQAAFTIPIILAVCELSFRFVEQPFIRLGGRLVKSLTAPKAVGVAAAETPAPLKRAG
jgi:peptidoglycan/LPS O-acetylase OafA/YrhL